MGIFALSLSTDGKYLVCSGGNNIIKLWNLIEKKEEFSFAEHSDAVYSSAFSPDGSFFVSGSGDNTIKIWRLNSEKVCITKDIGKSFVLVQIANILHMDWEILQLVSQIYIMIIINGLYQGILM